MPQDIECIPCILEVQYDGATISLGKDLGQRASVSVAFRDVKHSDAGSSFDKYFGTRGFDQYKQGTFWGKFRARNPFLIGRAMRLIRGLSGNALASMETHNFVIDSFTGPDADGIFRITAKDVLKLVDDDRAVCPHVSNGYLKLAVTSSATSATLNPAGIGNSEYPSSGFVAIAGREICSFTRSADVLTITRAQMGTTAVAHNVDDRVQVVKQYAAADPADILNDLFVNFGGVPSVYIPLTQWKAETAAYLQRNYTANIANPVGVNSLASELIEQAALAVWWDSTDKLLRLQVLRDTTAGASTIDETNTLENTLEVADQPEARLSEVWTYFGMRNPLEPIDRTDNFRSILATVAAQQESDYGAAAIKTIFSRWIPDNGRTIAQRVNDIQLARFKDPPRMFAFQAWRSPEVPTSDVVLGTTYKLGAWMLQDDTGAAALVPVQVIRLRPEADRYLAVAEEVSWAGVVLDDPNVHNIIIDSNSNNVNLRTLHDVLYPAPVSGNTVNCTISTGVIVGSANTATVAFDVGSWPAGVTVNLIINGRIEGAGGTGGSPFVTPNTAGGPGGTALYTRRACNVTNNNQIWGGGGGGGAKNDSKGGAGGGQVPGGSGATTEAGEPSVAPFFRAAGGDPGFAGANGITNGGAAGNAVDGTSFVTYVVAGDRRGPLIN